MLSRLSPSLSPSLCPPTTCTSLSCLPSPAPSSLCSRAFLSIVTYPLCFLTLTPYTPLPRSLSSPLSLSSLPLLSPSPLLSLSLCAGPDSSAFVLFRCLPPLGTESSIPLRFAPFHRRSLPLLPTHLGVRMPLRARHVRLVLLRHKDDHVLVDERSGGHPPRGCNDNVT